MKQTKTVDKGYEHRIKQAVAAYFHRKAPRRPRKTCPNEGWDAGSHEPVEPGQQLLWDKVPEGM